MQCNEHFLPNIQHAYSEWNEGDLRKLKQAKDGELQKKHSGHVPFEEQISANIITTELSKDTAERSLVWIRQ